MSARRTIALSLALAAIVAAPLLVQHRAAVELRRREDLVRQQTMGLAKAAAENKRLASLLAGLRIPQPLSGPELTELLRLRNEVGQLRQALQEQDRLENESGRMREAIKNLTEGAGAGTANPLALLAEELDLRRARLAQLNKWLETHPDEKIPELRFLSEDGWIRSADWQRVTDEELRGWIGAQRGNASGRFGSLAYKALKAYAKANDGQFPTELAQLQPFFEAPIEDAILQRYTIVPAKSLIENLAAADDNWVITQKAPINEKRDSRMAVGLKSSTVTVAAGRWGNGP